jgi:hypothetical protein
MNRIFALGAVSALMAFSFAPDCRASVEQGRSAESKSVQIFSREGPRNLVCNVNRDGSTKCVMRR